LVYVSLHTRRVVPLAAILTAPLLASLAIAHAEAAAAEAAAAADNHPAAVVIRVYEIGARSPELTATLAESMTRLLDRIDTDIDVQFVDCAIPQACASVSRSALVLRLVPGVHATAERQCGEASKGVGTQRGVLMTVFRGCVAETRRELRTGAITEQGISFALLSLTESDILAAVVVHELIHLVLPDEVHGKGLFKATLDARDWLDMVAGWPQLDTALVSRLDRALTAPRVTETVLAERRMDATPTVAAAQQQQP
jgi:hypothetical protein